MKPSAQHSFAERLGQILGRMWRGCLRQERKMNGWLVEHGLPAGGATALLWIIKLVVLGLLLYAAFWMVLVLLFAVVAAWMVRDSDDDASEEWAVGEQAEHKINPGYHPALYNDAPDSRYADAQHDDD
ncbi:DUF3742 family protein [Pseudomonas helleri]|uniref:DUF3742 family protein n=1 Tax=Pseudomonas helleri TaxID=1608996 RepID=A0A6L5HZB3_9PSED|nr:DUF3742 family protein [Pseudomonas helleri]MQU08732.1 DUF3742 family protein [Pseudomonas helleri]